MKLANWADLKAFFKADRWTLDRTTGDEQFEKTLPEGTVLRSKKSKGKDDEDIGRDLFSRILRIQLRVSEDAFWSAIRDGRPAARPGSNLPAAPAQSLPLWLTAQLKKELGLTDGEIANLTRDEADARLVAKRSNPKP